MGGSNITSRIKSLNNKVNKLLLLKKESKESTRDAEEKIKIIIRLMHDAMIDKGITHSLLADKTGLGRESLYKIINVSPKIKYRQNPNLLTLLLILKACDLEIHIKPKGK